MTLCNFNKQSFYSTRPQYNHPNVRRQPNYNRGSRPRVNAQMPYRGNMMQSGGGRLSFRGGQSAYRRGGGG